MKELIFTLAGDVIRREPFTNGRDTILQVGADALEFDRINFTINMRGGPFHLVSGHTRVEPGRTLTIKGPVYQWSNVHAQSI